MGIEAYSFANIGEGTTATATLMGSATLIAPTPGAGGTITGAFSAGMFGSGAKHTCGTTATCLTSVTVASPSLSESFSFYYLTPATAFTVKTAIVIVRGGLSGTAGAVARVNVGTDWSLEAQGQAFSGTTTFGAAAIIAALQWYRFELRCIAATTTTGTFRVSVYPMFGTITAMTTAIATFSSTTYNVGTDVMTRIDLGVGSTQTAALTVGVSNLTIDNAQAATEIGGWAQSTNSGAAVAPFRDYGPTGTTSVSGSTLVPVAKIMGDGSDTTSVVIGTTGTYRFVFPKMPTPAADAWAPTIRQRLQTAGTGTFQVKAYDTGGTLRKTWTVTPVAGSIAPQTLTALTAGEVATFNNFDAVSLELVRT